MKKILNEMINQSMDIRNDDALIYIKDDLEIKNKTDDEMEQVYTIIDARYKSKKPMIATTNLSLKNLKKPINSPQSRVYDRTLQCCAPVAF